jgi:hypothetical protein
MQKDPYDINIVEIVAMLFKDKILKNSSNVNLAQTYAYFPEHTFEDTQLHSGFMAINKPMNLGSNVETSFGNSSSIQPLYLATAQVSLNVICDDALKDDFANGDSTLRQQSDGVSWKKYYYCLPLSAIGIKQIGAITFDISDDIQRTVNRVVQFQFTKRFVFTPAESSTVEIVQYLKWLLDPTVQQFQNTISNAWKYLHRY